MDETYTLPDYRDTHAVDFSGENDALTPGNAVSWANNSKSTSHIAWSDLSVVANFAHDTSACRR